MCRKLIYFEPTTCKLQWMTGSSCIRRNSELFSLCHLLLYRSVRCLLRSALQAKNSRLFNCFLDRNHSIPLNFFLAFLGTFSSFIVPVSALICSSNLASKVDLTLQNETVAILSVVTGNSLLDCLITISAVQPVAQWLTYAMSSLVLVLLGKESFAFLLQL